MINVDFFVISFGMRVLLLLLILCTPLLGTEELVVHLGVQESLIPLYLAPFHDNNSQFSKSYLNSLEKVFRFDFENDGKIELSSSPKAYLCIETEIEQKSASVKFTSGGIVKGIEGIILTGELTKDRRTLHRIHDTIFHTLFNTSGIAETHILYTIRNRNHQQPEKWISEVWTADYDGMNAKQVTQEGNLCVTPTFIPTKHKGPCHHFLYVSYKIGQPKIFAGTLNNAQTQRLTYLKGNQLMPAISPLLDKIAFISDITGNPDLFIQEFSLEKGVKGKPSQVFCAPGATQGTPTFSPDGKKLAFVSNKDGSPRIYIMDIPLPGISIQNLQPKLISRKTKENTCPAWSPDGKKIAYSAMTSGTRQIWIYDVFSGEELQLTEGPGHKENPAWAPNSLHLIFNASNASSSELYMINLNQKKALKITNGQGEKRFPAWEPARYT